MRKLWVTCTSAKVTKYETTVFYPVIGHSLRANVTHVGHRRPKLSMLSCFFPFYVNVQANMTYGMYYYITIEFDHAKHDSRLAAYGGVVLQQFEFIKVCMGMQRLCLKSQLFLYFVNKIYLP